MSLDAARSRLKRWRTDPIAFVRENFNVEPDAWQVKALLAFARQDMAAYRISLQACVGPGKTAVLAWIGWNFLSCYGNRNDHPKGLAVSVTADNLKDNLWPEFAHWRNRSAFLMEAFEWTKERIFSRDHPETWFIAARSWSKTANAEEQGRTLSGLHSKFVLVLIDESGEIPLSVLKAGEQALGNVTFGRIVQAGNPTSLDGMLYAAATRLRDQWEVIVITGDPDDPDRSPRISLEWAAAQINAYGRDNPWVMSSILGKFPPGSINALIGVEEVEAAMKRHLTEDAFSWAQKRLGIDCARFGDDPWVVFPRQGLAAFRPVVMRNPRTHDVVARVILAKSRWGSEREFFDGSGGYAAGAVDGMIQAGHSPVEVQFGGKATDPRFFNKRSEMLFLAAEHVKRGAALPYIPEMIQEMSAHTYTFQNGKFRVEEKDLVKEKIGRSPNYFDAYGLTFAEPDMPSQTDSLLSRLGIRQGNHAADDFDPFRDPDRERERAITEFDPFRPEL
jgi:phage terminase large subunit